MISSRDKVEIALRAAMIAKTILSLTGPLSKTRAGIFMMEATRLLAELDKIIGDLPED